MFHQDLLLDYHKYMKKNLIIITPYPKTGKYSHETSALASFNKNLVDILKTQYNIVILADNENNKNAYEVGGCTEFPVIDFENKLIELC